MSCEYSREVQLRYDGRLSEADGARVAAHLEVCAECRREAEEIVMLGRMLAGARRPAISPDAMARLRGLAEEVRERDILRVARRLTAAAAVLLIVGLTALLSGSPAPARAPAAWERAMLGMTAAETGESSELASPGESTDIRQWLEAGPSRNGGHE